MPLADLGLVQAVQGPGRLHVRPQQWCVAEPFAGVPLLREEAGKGGTELVGAAVRGVDLADDRECRHRPPRRRDERPFGPGEAIVGGGIPTEERAGLRREGRRWWRAPAGVCARRVAARSRSWRPSGATASGVVSPRSNVCGRRPVAGSATASTRARAARRAAIQAARRSQGRCRRRSRMARSRPRQRASSSPTSRCSRRTSQMPLVGLKGASASFVAKQSTTCHARRSIGPPLPEYR